MPLLIKHVRSEIQLFYRVKYRFTDHAIARTKKVCGCSKEQASFFIFLHKILRFSGCAGRMPYCDALAACCKNVAWDCNTRIEVYVIKVRKFA